MRSNSPSDTATLIARAILLASKDPELAGLLAPGEEAALRRILGERASRGWFGYAMRHAWARWVLRAGESLLLRGIIAHYLVRKRWIEREVRRAIAEGVRQIAVVGAGYDTLAWRLHAEFPEIAFFEIDHPATQAAKRTALGEPANLHFHAADLSRELPLELLAPCRHFSMDQPALMIAEGLTMYFEPARVSALLGSMAHAAGPAGRVIFSYMEQAGDGSIGFRRGNSMIGCWLRLRSEPFRWGCKRGELTAFLARCGLHPEALANHVDLRATVLRPLGLERLPLARGECFCLGQPFTP